MFTEDELKIIMHCKEIELTEKEASVMIYLFRNHSKKRQMEIMEDVTRMNTLEEILELMIDE